MSEKNELEEGLELMVQFEKKNGIIPAIAQDYKTKEILMLAYVNRLALDETLDSGYATFWSTSRNKLWKKGMESGNYMVIKDILVDCDQDALIYLVQRAKGGACHTPEDSEEKRISCFYRRIRDNNLEFIQPYGL
jgi:phosphoribosyl-AMP cyclohydrolase|tara:strand:+ start:710 stop:1114 length:405 start_codon:yes stop_codon:yes gene_type:complete